MNEVTGNLTGLKPSALKALERVFRRRVSPQEVVSAELGGYINRGLSDIDWLQDA